MDQEPGLSPSAGDGPNIVEDEDVWMDDGNIVVSAGTNPILLFKCHRSILTTVSDVFKDVLLIPASAINKTYQGLPVVHLPDDPEDVRALLRLLYNATRLLTSRDLRGHCSKGPLLLGPLRLAHKYQMGNLLRELSSILEEDYPHNYSHWLGVHEVIGTKMTRFSDESLSYGEIHYERFYGADPALIIRAARDGGLDNVLPVAFYEMYMWYPSMDEDPVFTYLPVHPEHLYEADRRRFDRGRENLEIAFSKAWDAIRTTGPSRQCKHNGAANPACAKVVKTWCNAAALVFFRERFTEFLPRKPLEMLSFKAIYNNMSEADKLLSQDMCPPCLMALTFVIKRQRADIWCALPQIFDIPGVRMELGLGYWANA